MARAGVMEGYSLIVRRRFYTRYGHGRICGNSAMGCEAASREGVPFRMRFRPYIRMRWQTRRRDAGWPGADHFVILILG
jgi:hypothetical protein